MMMNIECLLDACNSLKIPYKVLDEHSNFISIGERAPIYFIQTKTPFNRADVERICRDKDYTYKLLKDAVPMPVTRSFLDPYVDTRYEEYKKERNYKEIIDEVKLNFAFPLIIKMNSGSVGKNVYLCQNELDLKKAVEKIFNHFDKDHDYLLLAQEYVRIAKEYRVIVRKGRVALAYLKDNSSATFSGNLSPLHWENGTAVLIESQSLLLKFQSICDTLSTYLESNWLGLDIAVDENGKFFLLEMNSSPSFAYFVRDNGKEAIMKLYTDALSELDLR